MSMYKLNKNKMLTFKNRTLRCDCGAGKWHGEASITLATRSVVLWLKDA